MSLKDVFQYLLMSFAVFAQLLLHLHIMPRVARIILPGVPHHVTQRGNRRMQTFFCDDDYRFYLELIYKWFPHFGIELLCYCLMPNHVHHLLTPFYQDSLARGLGEVHKRYTRMINFRMGWRGHLWQSRFYSDPLEQTEIENAYRYIELNPVRANLVSFPENYRWSTAYNANRGQVFYSKEYDIEAFRNRTAKGLTNLKKGAVPGQS